jgi:hypothetical protein
MEQEKPRRISADDLDHERYLDHSFDLVARVRAAKEAAQREMETFGDVSEYEIRKIYGQRTDITYDDVDQKEEDPKSSSPAGRESTADERQADDRSNSSRDQSAFDFKAEDTQPGRKEE